MTGDDLEPFDDLAGFARGRDALFERVVEVLSTDARVAAAWLSGSFGRDEADGWADFDLHVAVRDEHFNDFLNFRQSLYEQLGDPVIVQDDMPSDSMPGGRFQLVVFAGAIEVDWNVGPLSKAVRPLAYEMIIERAQVPVFAPVSLTKEQRREYAQRSLTFFWAMVQIAAKYAGRSDTRRAVRQIDLLSGTFIALSRLATQPDGPTPVDHSTNRILETEIDARLPRVGHVIDPASTLDVIEELCLEVSALHPTLVSIGVEPPAAMPRELPRLISVARRVSASGDPPRRKYR